MKTEHKANVKKAQVKRWESYRNKAELLNLSVPELKAMRDDLWDSYSKLNEELDAQVNALAIKKAEEEAWAKYKVVKSILALKTDDLKDI
jgi:succinate dehydrogenase flavin-adding protein (antitoxin of CptAB toxin-antitoxin module)